jgi:hypothetical protein
MRADVDWLNLELEAGDYVGNLTGFDDVCSKKPQSSRFA